MRDFPAPASLRVHTPTEAGPPGPSLPEDVEGGMTYEQP